jgi:hypothetical protein
MSIINSFISIGSILLLSLISLRFDTAVLKISAMNMENELKNGNNVAVYIFLLSIISNWTKSRLSFFCTTFD